MSKRKRYTATQKVKILCEHLENQVPVSELCKCYVSIYNTVQVHHLNNF